MPRHPAVPPVSAETGQRDTSRQNMRSVQVPRPNAVPPVSAETRQPGTSRQNMRPIKMSFSLAPSFPVENNQNSMPKQTHQMCTTRATSSVSTQTESKHSCSISSLEKIDHLHQYVEHAVQSKIFVLPRTSQNEIFQFRPLQSKAEIDAFDNQLGCDGVFKGNIFNFILSIVNNTRINYILHRAIDVIFSRSLFADCSWTGCYRSGAKIGLISVR